MIMKTVKLTIPNMKSPHCQMTVSAIVTSLGATVDVVKAGEIEIRFDDSISREAVVAAVEAKGYLVNS